MQGKALNSLLLFMLPNDWSSFHEKAFWPQPDDFWNIFFIGVYFRNFNSSLRESTVTILIFTKAVETSDKEQWIYDIP